MYCPFHVRVWTSFQRYVLLLCQSYNLTINQTQINRKRTATVPKKCLHIQDRCIMDLILVRRRVTRRIIRIKLCASVMELKNMVKITTVFHLPKQDRNRTGTENEFNSRRYYEFACFRLHTSKIIYFFYQY